MNPPNAVAPRASIENLASNLHWSWDTAAAELLATLPGAEPGVHPAVVLAGLDDETVADWAATHADALAEAIASLDAVVAAVDPPAIAYFSPEFGVAAEVAQYSGGLGILAGDHLKAASDLALPLMGIGLLYHEGFFRQGIVDGRQTERYETIRPESIGAIDTGERVSVDVDGVPVVCAVWRQMVGATPLVLLDTDLPENAAKSRRITDRLYSGDRRHRLSQELVLGVGGVRALRALGISPEVFHLNEGHACFLLLELLGEHVDAGATLDEAIAAVRAATLFTTHTPVPAGIDRFERKLVTPEMKPWAARLGVTVDEICDWATMPDDGPDQAVQHRGARHAPVRPGQRRQPAPRRPSVANCSRRCPGPRASRASPTASMPAPGSGPRWRPTTTMCSARPGPTATRRHGRRSTPSTPLSSGRHPP